MMTVHMFFTFTTKKTTEQKEIKKNMGRNESDTQAKFGIS